ncbi:MAG: hypothetical protein OXH27_00640 [Gammaproteobacteria bacterium]|nr:hypothetical protein [Gammaproteobacteria bacterium]MCY3687514.1 hypothetical protein [Gammaproteobacteria bacterium]MXY90054.1 DUF2029 domain-containing protein [Gammaproteobacteria bacterium]MYG96712.1 DUF2029 domain-containing protein [Gammaproteobacteria bacterium]
MRTSSAGLDSATPYRHNLGEHLPVDLVGLFCALGYVALAVLAKQSGEPQLFSFFVLMLWTGLPVLGLYLFALRRDRPISLGRLFFWALAFRICGLYGGPLFEDDFFRYLWDGYRFATAGTPYGVAPEAFFVDSSVPAAFQAVLSQINNPDLQTIYAPVTQFVFLLAYWLRPASVEALQVLLILVDLGVIVLLLRLTSPRNALLYAWCPLIVKEIAFTAHPDGIGVFLLLAAIVLARDKRWRGSAVLLGLAAGAKVLALVVAPLLLARARPIHWILFVLTIAVLYAPFMIMGGTDLTSFAIFAREWEFNSALFGLLAAVMDRFDARVLLGLAYAAFWLAYARQFVSRQRFSVPRGDWLFGVLLLVSPVINPWYLIWLLPFAAIYPSAWAWTASLAALLSYVSGINLFTDPDMQAYEQPLWARLLEFALIGAALLFDLRRRAAASAGRVSNS